MAELLSLNLPGVDYRVSYRAAAFLKFAYKGEGADILIMTPEVLKYWAEHGALVERDGVYHFVDEVGKAADEVA